MRDRFTSDGKPDARTDDSSIQPEPVSQEPITADQQEISPENFRAEESGGARAERKTRAIGRDCPFPARFERAEEVNGRCCFGAVVRPGQLNG